MTGLGLNETATDLLKSVRHGEVSVANVVTAHLDGLRKVHAMTNAVAAFEDERALGDARGLDRALAKGDVLGPLHGLPVTVKDWIDVEGFPCAGGSSEHRNRRPTEDATAVARLRNAGCVVIAKTSVWSGLDEGSRVTHPLDAGRTPGGSSSGEAVVVATGASILGIGSDSGGSIRLPAAWCGVFGLKPTSGRVPGTGHFPRIGSLSDGRTQIGPIARSVDDLELVLTVISGPDWRDAGVPPVPLLPSESVEMQTIRFAVVGGEPDWKPQKEIATAVEHTAHALESAGAARVSWKAPWLIESLDITRRYWKRDELSGEETDRQLRDWDEFRRAYLEAAEEVELLVTPVTRETAPLYRDIGGDDFVFTLPASLTGSPAVAMPLGHDRSGMPLSVQLIGRPWEDHKVIAAARVVAAAG